MNMCAWYWRGSALATGLGVAITATNFETGNPWLLVGLTLVLVGASVANTGFIAQRARSLDDEFEAGHRIGYRAGRRAARLVPVPTVTPILSKAVQHGGIPKAPVGTVAGDDPASRWSTTHTL